MELRFILCKPGIPENIGAAARALFTMGFSDLCLVKPCSHLNLRARSMACGAVSVLEQARVFSSLRDATQEVDLVIGTTARPRRSRQRYYTPRQIRELLQKKESSLSRIALVFGAETAGMSTAELSHCDLLSTIASHKEQPSLNLAQTVMVYAYELSYLAESPGRAVCREQDEGVSQLVFRKKIRELFELLGMNPNKPVYNRILERLAALSDNDIRMAHYLRKKILAKILGPGRGR